MRIVVIGGTGMIGPKLVAKLGARGHEAVLASLNSGANTLTGEGLADALEGASVVVDVTNLSSASPTPAKSPVSFMWHLRSFNPWRQTMSPLRCVESRLMYR